MVEKFVTPGSNVVVDFARYQAGRDATGNAAAMSARTCRHCGAAMLDGENQDDCSSVLGMEIEAPRLRIIPRKMRVE